MQLQKARPSAAHLIDCTGVPSAASTCWTAIRRNAGPASRGRGARREPRRWRGARSPPSNSFNRLVIVSSLRPSFRFDIGKKAAIHFFSPGQKDTPLSAKLLSFPPSSLSLGLLYSASTSFTPLPPSFAFPQLQPKSAAQVKPAAQVKSSCIASRPFFFLGFGKVASQRLTDIRVRELVLPRIQHLELPSDALVVEALVHHRRRVLDPPQQRIPAAVLAHLLLEAVLVRRHRQGQDASLVIHREADLHAAHQQGGRSRAHADAPAAALLQQLHQHALVKAARVPVLELDLGALEERLLLAGAPRRLVRRSAVRRQHQRQEVRVVLPLDRRDQQRELQEIDEVVLRARLGPRRVGRPDVLQQPGPEDAMGHQVVPRGRIALAGRLVHGQRLRLEVAADAGQRVQQPLRLQQDVLVQHARSVLHVEDPAQLVQPVQHLGHLRLTKALVVRLQQQPMRFSQALHRRGFAVLALGVCLQDRQDVRSPGDLGQGVRDLDPGGGERLLDKRNVLRRVVVPDHIGDGELVDLVAHDVQHGILAPAPVGRGRVED
eukprot:scaffold664_cov260-Pinguiococcus_pyrenoidosus.AAC.25